MTKRHGTTSWRGEKPGRGGGSRAWAARRRRGHNGLGRARQSRPRASVPINVPAGDVADVLADELREPTSPTTTLPTWDECVDPLLGVYELIKATAR